ncbi:unnamed protein product, partial [marine sediment metagenome]
MRFKMNRMPLQRIFMVAVAVLAIRASASGAEKPPLIAPFQTDPGERTLSANEIAALELTAAEVPEVLKVISDISGWTIIPSGKLTGKISFFAKDTT